MRSEGDNVESMMKGVLSFILLGLLAGWSFGPKHCRPHGPRVLRTDTVGAWRDRRRPGGRAQRAAPPRGAARSVREDTGGGAALDAESRSGQAERKSSGADRRRRCGGVEFEVRVSAPDRWGAAPAS